MKGLKVKDDNKNIIWLCDSIFRGYDRRVNGKVESIEIERKFD